MDIDEVTSDSTVDQISDHWQLAYGEIVAAHIVASPPSDHSNGNEEVLIAELRQDLDTRPLQTDILALVDIEFKLPLGAALAVHWRKVLWLRSTSTRAGVLHQLRSFDLCHHRPNFACVLFLNNVHWPDTDTAIRHFVHGDYFRLVVICPADTAPRDAAADLRAFERAEVARRVFCAEDSSSSSPRGGSAPHSPRGSVSVTSEPDDQVASDSPSPHGEAQLVQLRLGSANVRSLKEGTEKGGFADKVELISAQVRQHGFDVFAVQEARGKEDRVAHTFGLFRLVSAACRGQGGVELWVNPQGPLASAGCGPLGITHFHILSSSPAWLIVDCDHPLLQCIFVVAYAPQSGREAHEIDAWWDSFRLVLRPLINKELVLMGDFNAHMGSVETEGVGGLAWTDENAAGTHLRLLIEDHNMCVPSTFEHFHQGTSVTFPEQ